MKRIVLFAILLLLLSTMATGQQIVIGNGADGSQYELAMPNVWNGTLVVYAHGVVDPEAPVRIPDEPKIVKVRDALLANGFAMARSSFSSNGYGVKDAMQHTHELKGLFTTQFSRPRRTLLMGTSMGGLVVVGLAEKYPAQYDGALSMCGILGGSQAETDYVAAYGQVLYDFFFTSGAFGSFPYSLPGNAGNPVLLDFFPGSPAYEGLKKNFIAGLALPYQVTLHFVATAGILVNQEDPNEVVNGAMNVLGFNVRYAVNMYDRTHSWIPFDNTETKYSDPRVLDDKQREAFDAVINSGVQRYTTHPDAVKYIEHSYTPSGSLAIPLLTMHTTRDPLVPVWHEARYLKSATDTGSAEKFLVQTQFERFGHCTFTPPEILAAFAKLVTWVETGVKPEPAP